MNGLRVQCGTDQRPARSYPERSSTPSVAPRVSPAFARESSSAQVGGNKETRVRMMIWGTIGTMTALAVAIAGVGGERIQAAERWSDNQEGLSAQALAQCTSTPAFLQIPTGILQSNTGNLLVAESGTAAPNTGRISIVDLDGHRRTLLSGLPSGISDVGTPNGPSGLFMRGRTLFVAVGSGDVGRNGPVPGTSIPNPTSPPSSPIFSSVLAIHLSSRVEQTTEGFAMTLSDQQALASGQAVTIAHFSAPGTYVIQAVATDGALQTRADVTVTVQAGGTKP